MRLTFVLHLLWLGIVFFEVLNLHWSSHGCLSQLGGVLDI